MATSNYALEVISHHPQFKNKKLRVLVATDLLARGIDIEFLPYVVNYELPRSPKDFVHRIGRTGRAENPGKAITFVTPDDAHHFKVIQKKMKKKHQDKLRKMKKNRNQEATNDCCQAPSKENC